MHLSESERQQGRTLFSFGIENQEPVNHPNKNLDQIGAFTGVDILVEWAPLNKTYLDRSINIFCLNHSMDSATTSDPPNRID